MPWDYLVAKLWPTLVTPCQAPLSMGFPRQEYWSGLPCSSSRDCPDLGIKLSCIAGRFFTIWATGYPESLPGFWNPTSLLEALLLLLLLSRFSRVRLCATSQTAAHQAPPSLGFSRQEYWSGLPFPSPMQESEKWKWSRSVVSDS